ncbi:hypothetical protein SLEP1_g44450 [Rubroshorea leprosula]|uniref:Uncharacterized protein n=1 Tax=Rubroshorea leprosula TaxID=152421 RepID=A0AAV5LH86_9ROSI|nr:hypothetical protein SLEP1_g44450 [Rubroshorea leprosula]
MSTEIIDIDLEGDSDGSGNEGDWGIEKHVLFIHIGGRLIQQDNGLKYVDGECWDWHVDIDKLTVRELFQKISITRYDPDMGVDGEFRVEESQKESVVEDYYEPGQDFTAKGVWLEKEDEAGVEKEDEAGIEKERAGASKSDNVADDHNDDLDGDKEAEGDEGHYDPVMDIPELTDNEDEEAMEAKKKVKSFCYNFQEHNAGPSSYHDGAGPSTLLAAIHDDGDEMQSDAEYSCISTDEDDGSNADHASRGRATHAVYEEVEDALPDIRLG